MSDATLKQLLNDAYRYALALCQHQHTAEDLVQTAWVGLLKVNGPRNRPYLFRSIRNHYININKRHQLIAMDSLEEMEGNDQHLDNEEQLVVDRLIHHQDLEILLTSLRSIEREFLFLHYYQGLTHQEIADHSGLSRNTVLSILHRMTKKLRQQRQRELEAEL